MSLKLSRSPRYPQIGLREALAKAASVYKADLRHRIPKELVAEHMGYGSLNGASLGIISAVSKYGLLDGNRDAMWITPRAVDILEREPGDPERIAAVQAAASEPELFRAIDEQFPGGKASDSAIRSFLITKREFLPDSAVKVIRAYRETRELVDAESGGYDSGLSEPESEPMQAVINAAPAAPPPAVAAAPSPIALAPAASLVAQEGEREWIRGPLSRGTSYRLVVSGDMGPREIGKLIKLLEAQQAILSDDDDDHDDIA
jgi:hypothetical protein